MLNDFGYLDSIIKNLQDVKEKQSENIIKAAGLMADAIAEDKLIHVYGGGGHTTLCMGEHSVCVCECVCVLFSRNLHCTLHALAAANVPELPQTS